MAIATDTLITNMGLPVEKMYIPSTQEPAAWKWRVKNFCDWPNWSVSLKRPADSGHAQCPRTEGYEDIPLYTRPPQRTWVGLTLEQYVAINSSCVTVDEAIGFTERQLKENNND
jgi:hypothetical protein